MAKNVNDAFNTFNKDFVNLTPDRTDKARSSRDWLYVQLNNLPDNDTNFPLKYEEKHIKFGSFARNTKIRELDDIDLIYCLHADNAYYSENIYSDSKYFIHTENAGQRLKNLSDDNKLNSRKILNKFVSSLENIEHYKLADVHRRQEAATLQLSSYEWNFDIVPAFHTTKEFYLIPDGNGNWKATNPIIDQDKVTSVNQKHNGEILQIIRTLKYWNRHAKMPTIGSYLFENFILNYFNSKNKILKYIDINMIKFWLYLKKGINESVADPKGFQEDLNDLSSDDKVNISNKASEAYDKGYEAYIFETEDKDQKKAINKWKEIFGEDFPNYE
jgi:hypothetical protein